MYSLIKQIIKVGIKTEKMPGPCEEWQVHMHELHKSIVKKFGRALAIRHVDAGSCNGCELEIHALNNPYYNIEGIGIHFVASPRHADLLLVTGPVSRNMVTALKRTYEAVPDPKWVVALGDCARGEGIFKACYAICSRISDVIPVNVVVPGCPPSPINIIQGILTAVHQKENK